ncbi:MAG: zinc ribbon domain-containing protein [Gammaproteobacteria bacterium]|nr:zinc ribbon domain-containing protein [Gammaproteobacteria bacterium]MDD9824998.1 zinc ribbon domain-containing protein [Gammaproteobacteria bacterium]MDD9863378.1 zinc ribbon domain-containing protein [Gammaproteobacteria bacterium]
MPIYEYRCDACDHFLEALQKMSDAPLVQCPECGRPGLRKLISASSFRLKGTGWYVTDFRDSGKGKPAAERNGGDGKKAADGDQGAGKPAAGGEGAGKSGAKDGKRAASGKTGAADSGGKAGKAGKAEAAS